MKYDFNAVDIDTCICVDKLNTARKLTEQVCHKLDVAAIELKEALKIHEVCERPTYDDLVHTLDLQISDFMCFFDEVFSFIALYLDDTEALPDDDE